MNSLLLVLENKIEYILYMPELLFALCNICCCFTMVQCIHEIHKTAKQLEDIVKEKKERSRLRK